MSDESLLTRTLSLSSYGLDVWGAKRIVYRGLDKEDGGRRLRAFEYDKNGKLKPERVKQLFGPFFRTDVKKMQRLLGFKENGQVDQSLLKAMGRRGYPDARAIDLLNQYIDNHKKPPPPPKLVEPKQGFDSLDRRLWPLYTTGRNMGLWDLGTYNPHSRLPSGSPSDHATGSRSGHIGQPVVAFDLGFSPATGYAHPIARGFFHMMAGHAEVNYVILGNKIWSVERGLHAYTYGGHEGHVHVSGFRR